MDRQKIDAFRKAVDVVCKEYGMSFFVFNDECYDCQGGSLNVCEALQGSENVQTLPYFDLQEWIDDQTALAAEEKAWQDEREETIRRRNILFPKIVDVCQKHQMVLWMDRFVNIKIVPLTDAMWQNIALAPLEKNTIRDPKLLERRILPMFVERKQAFLDDLKKVFWETNMIPHAFLWTSWIKEAEDHPSAFKISPMYDDGIPEWVKT